MDNLHEIINYAIERELEAAEFYKEMQTKVHTQAAKEMLLEFEKMELAHADVLRYMDINKLQNYNQPKITNMQLSDYMVEPEIHENISLQEIFVVAMKREEAAAKLYNDLAEKAENETVKNMFLKLATEESKHKLRLESTYDDEVNYEF